MLPYKKVQKDHLHNVGAFDANHSAICKEVHSLKLYMRRETKLYAVSGTCFSVALDDQQIYITAGVQVIGREHWGY